MHFLNECMKPKMFDFQGPFLRIYYCFLWYLSGTMGTQSHNYGLESYSHKGECWGEAAELGREVR